VFDLPRLRRHAEPDQQRDDHTHEIGTGDSGGPDED